MKHKMRESNTIIIPIDENEYNKVIHDRTTYRKVLDNLIARHPEIFPFFISKGYSFLGWSKSKVKTNLARRIIRLNHSGGTNLDYLIHPCFEMPYLRGKTSEVSKGLHLRKYSTPYHVIADNHGANAMYWYRAELSLGCNNIVGTTVKRMDKMPRHLIVDEHHSRLKGNKVYICTTVGGNCFLGAAVSNSISFSDLRNAYGIFKSELNKLHPNYKLLTINTDGFRSTVKAIKHIYPDVLCILCFLHAYLKIQTNATKEYSEFCPIIYDKIWSAYRSNDQRSFAQKIRRLEEWTTDNVPDSLFKNSILKLCQKKRICQTFYLFTMSKNF